MRTVGDDGLVVERLLQLDILLEERGDALHQLLGRRGSSRIGSCPRAPWPRKKPSPSLTSDGLGALHALDENLDVAIRHAHALHDVADRADL